MTTRVRQVKPDVNTVKQVCGYVPQDVLERVRDKYIRSGALDGLDQLLTLFFVAADMGILNLKVEVRRNEVFLPPHEFHYSGESGGEETFFRAIESSVA